MAPRLMGIADAGRYLGQLSERAVWRLIRDGRLHRVQLPGVRRTLLDIAELDALIERGRKP